MSYIIMRKAGRRVFANCPLKSVAVLAFFALAACEGTGATELHVFPKDSRVITGPNVTKNTTPVTPAFTCLASKIKAKDKRKLRITSGEVLDLTGKYLENEGGSIVTKGGAHMVMSALGKLGDAIILLERVDTLIADKELQYMDRRQLGDGGEHIVPGEAAEVPWLPYFGGTVLQTDYYIAGAITELNFNISSKGGEVGFAGFGVKASALTMNVAVDLRIVDAKSMEVISTTSLQKQIIGEEIGADVFRFFGDYLFDLNTGRRTQEPIQLAVRTTLELAVIELIATLTKADPSSCIQSAEDALSVIATTERADPIVAAPADVKPPNERVRS
ncbi:MAG: hypothetical protein KGZ72_10075 [Roseovarius sp.]|nr:hypothetical protein [Roseovarius sp.]